jgi:hypothetical protein
VIAFCFAFGDTLVDLGITGSPLSGPLRAAFRDLGKLKTDGDIDVRRGIHEFAETGVSRQVLIEVAPTRLGDHVHVHFWDEEKQRI